MTQSLLAALAQALRPVRQVRNAAEQALNDTLFDARKAVQVAMKTVFDRPTPFVLSGVKVTLPRQIRETSALTEATGLGPGRFGTQALVGIIAIDEAGRGKGPSQEQVLRAEVYGGARGLKGAERRLQSVGLMRAGQYMVPSREALQSQGDAYGNVRGPFIRTLLSDLQAFTTPGFTANSKAATIKRRAKFGRTGDFGPEQSVRPGFKTINGVVYFVSRGPGSVGPSGRKQNLPAGIWAKRGIHGSSIYPVFLFVSTPIYQRRLRFDEIVENRVQRDFPVRLAERMARVLSTSVR
jgi:hypothetical protein